MRGRRVLVIVLPFAVASLVSGCGGHPSSVTSSSGSPQASSSAQVRVGGVPGTPSKVTRAIARHARWRLPYAVGRQAVVQTGPGSVLMAGGLLPGDQSTDRVVRLSLQSGRAHRMASLPVPVHDTAGGLVGGEPTVIGGGNTAEQAVIQAWRPGGWRQRVPLPTARSDLSVVEWRGRAYVLGGYTGTSEPTAILRLSPRTPPRSVGDLVRGVRYAATARISRHAYVFGGEVSGRELGIVQRVDLATGRTTVVGRLPRPLGHAMAAAVDGRILVMGGRTSPSVQTDAMWWFDPHTGRFRRAGRLPTPLSDAAVVSGGHRVWLLGGETPTMTADVTYVSLHS